MGCSFAEALKLVRTINRLARDPVPPPKRRDKKILKFTKTSPRKEEIKVIASCIKTISSADLLTDNQFFSSCSTGVIQILNSLGK